MILLINLCVMLHSKAQAPSELLGRPTDVSISINVLSPPAMEIYWEYGIKQGNCSSMQTGKMGKWPTPIPFNANTLSHQKDKLKAISTNDYNTRLSIPTPSSR